MQFLHMIPPSTRTIGSFVKMIEEYFPEDEHVFYSTKKIAANDDLFDNDRVQVMTGTDRANKAGHVRDALKQADVIIWHGLFYNFRFMAFLYVYRRILKKSVWVIWGLDIHNYKTKGRGPKAFLYNRVNKVVRKKIKHAVAVFPTDKAVYESKFKGTCDVAPYAINIEALECMEAMRHADSRANGQVNVQVAHNAYPFNKHVEVMEKLKQFDDPNFRYYLPLSYGNGEEWPEHIAGYKLQIIDAAREMYGDRVSFINKLIPKEVYNDFLWNMDVAVFPANRQNGIGNIIKLLYMGNKVFMSNGNPAYRYFKEQGVEVLEFERMQEMSKEELVARGDNPKAREWVLNYYHPLGAARLWDKVFARFTAPSPILAKFADVAPAVEANPDYAFARKKNFLEMLPFISNRVSIECRRTYLWGIDPLALRWAGYLRTFIPNALPAGFITDEAETLGEEWSGDIDVVAGTAQARAMLDDGDIVCAISDPHERERVFNELYGDCPDDELPNFVAGRALGWQYVKIGKCAMISPTTQIYPFTTVGDLAIIEDSRVGAHCRIGNYATIKPGCKIGDEVTIGDYATVEADSIVPDGTVIAPGETYRG